MANPIQKLNNRLGTLESQVRGLAGGPQLGHSSIEDGAILEYDEVGQLASSIGKQFDGTHAQVTFAGPPPPVPVAAQVTPGPLSLTVRWSGRFAEDALSPMDFQQVEAHVSTDPGFDARDTSTLRATLRGELGDEVVISPLPAIPHYVRLVARSLSGKSSPPSPAVEGVPASISASTSDGKITVESRPPASADGVGKPANALWNELDANGAQVAVWRWDGAEWVDVPISETMLPLVNIADGTYGRLRGVQLEAKAIDGMVVTGAIIQTSISPNRGIKFTDTDIRAYNSVGTETFNLSAATGEASFLGRIRSGSEIEGAIITGGTFQTRAGVDGIKISGSEIRANGTDGNPIFWVNTDAQMVSLSGEINVLGSGGQGGIKIAPTSAGSGWDSSKAVIEFRSGSATETRPGAIYSFSDGNLSSHGLSLQLWAPRRSGLASPSLQLFAETSAAQAAAFLGDASGVGSLISLYGDGTMGLDAPDGIEITAPSVKINGRELGPNTPAVDCTVRPGFAMQGGTPPVVRMDGNRTYLSWGINGTNFGVNVAKSFADLPPGFAPSTWKYFPVTGSGARAGGMLIVKSNGELELRTTDVASPYYIFDAVSWFTGT